MPQFRRRGMGVSPMMFRCDDNRLHGREARPVDQPIAKRGHRNSRDDVQIAVEGLNLGVGMTFPDHSL